MKVKVEIKPLYRLVLHNKHICRGQYYEEDDWDLTFYGNTLEEIMEKAPSRMINSKINLSSAHLDIIVCLLYRDNIFEIEDPHVDSLKKVIYEMDQMRKDKCSPDELIRRITASPLYIRLDREYRVREAEEKRQKEEERRVEVEEAERKHYESLKEKYGP